MTPDVNVLVAASRSDHPHHPVAIRWLDDALDACALGQGLALLPMVAAGFLRLVTHPRVFVEPTPLAGARSSWRPCWPWKGWFCCLSPANGPCWSPSAGSISWWGTPSAMAGSRPPCLPAARFW